MALAVLSAGPLQIAWLLLGYGDTPDCACPENAFQIADAPAASEAIVRVQQALGAILAVATIAVIVRRRRDGVAEPPRSRSRRCWSTGAIAFALLIPWVLNDVLDEPLDDWPDAALGLALAAVPVAFLVGLLRERLARGAVADLARRAAGADGARGAAGRARARAARPVADRRLLGRRPLRRRRRPPGRAPGGPGGHGGRARRAPDRRARPRPGAGRPARARRLRGRRGRARARERAPAGRAARAAGGAARLARPDRRGRAGRARAGSSATCTTARSSGSSRSR